MNAMLFEFIGTAILLFIGNGVVANVVLSKTKGNNSGWIVITIGWAMSVFIAVTVASKGSDAHLNPAISLAMVVLGKINIITATKYIIGQILGAMLGSFLAWFFYKDHFDETRDAESILASFSTSPAIPKTNSNLISEILATFILILGVLMIDSPKVGIGSISAVPVSFLVLGIGLGLGGTTGYAINPARDLGPRIMHSILPIQHKGLSNWSYAWIPVIGPILGGILAAVTFSLFNF
jgi:glycerol uptake facilitator protein